MTDLAERLTEIEVRFTHQMRLIDELNDELIRANGRIDSLRREIMGLRETVSGMSPDLEQSPDE